MVGRLSGPRTRQRKGRAVMANCSNCQRGSLSDKKIETWVKRGGEWALLRNVPALVCDLCGERLFVHKVAELIAQLSSPTSTDRPTGLAQDLYIYDLDVLATKVASRQPTYSGTTQTTEGRVFATSAGEIRFIS